MRPTFDKEFMRDLLEGRMSESPVEYTRGRLRFDQVTFKFGKGVVVVTLLWRGKALCTYSETYGWKDQKAGATFTFDMTDPNFEASTFFTIN